MTKTVLITLTGLPYAGKTTLRNTLTKRFGFAVVSIDDINTEFRIGIDPDKKITQEDWNKSYSEAYTRLKQYLHDGKSVVFDGGSLLKKEREAQKQIARACGAQTMLVYVNTSAEVIKQRWIKNQETKERGHVPSYLFDKAMVMWEEPDLDECPVLYDQQMDVNEWIHTYIYPLTG